ncbi:MAG: carbamoyltransferase C-terminal domain-containing protein [bacterium]|nr:carbamoyltransferase C-terminal domain-containing protein [bacterium]
MERQLMKHNILGVKITNHDTGAALISGERIVAIAEERLNRIKHSRHMFPVKAIDYCLDALGINDRAVDLIVIDKARSREGLPPEEVWRQQVGSRFPNAEIHIVNHHDAHAASAFFVSPFEEAAVLIVDGAGDRLRDHHGVLGTETETLYRGNGNRLTEIQKTTHMREMTGFPYTLGIGKLYSFISNGYLNFGNYNEGKMMGLAPYGDDRILKVYPMDCWFRKIGSHVLCNPRITFEGILRVKGERKKTMFWGRVSTMWNEIFLRLGYAFVRLAARNQDPRFVEPKLFKKIVLGKARLGKDPLPEPYYAGVAFAVQKVLEEVMVAWGRQLKAVTACEALCLSGGVALNIDANKRFLDDVGFKRIFVQPAASDTGIALGCALWGAHQVLNLPRFRTMNSASLGRSYSEDEIEMTLSKYKERLQVKRSGNITAEAARLISEKKIVGWFQGGSEYGPRALGNRSILCDARDHKMPDIVNEKVKHREKWRPFAASVLSEKMSEWFDLEHESPFMLLAADVNKQKRTIVPAIVHVDGTCRIQSVTSEANKRYYELLSAFERETGVPLLLNTSFNDAGEPIVETPEDAVKCFLNTHMDVLVLEDFIITKC